MSAKFEGLAEPYSFIPYVQVNTVRTKDNCKMETAVEREPNERRKTILTGPTVTLRQALVLSPL